MKVKAKDKDLDAIKFIFKRLLNYNILTIETFNIFNNRLIDKEYN